MADYFASGRAIDVVLGIVLAEAIMLALRGKPKLDIVLALGPGVMLMLAVRAALTGAGWPWVAMSLTASLPLHLADMRRRRLI